MNDIAKEIILPWPSSSFFGDEESQVAAAKKRWPAEVANVVRTATSVAGELQALDVLVQEYVETGERLNAQRLLGRVVKNYVAPDEHLIWCGRCEGILAGTPQQRGDGPLKMKPFWVLVTTRNLFLLPNKTATPMSYGISGMLFVFTGGLRCSLGARGSTDFHQLYVVNGTGLQLTDGWNARYPGPGMRFVAAVLWAQKNKGKPLTATPRRTRVAVREVPAPRLIRRARDAELVAADWMQHWGLGKATVSPVGTDGGVDVATEQAVAQVKFEAVSVGRPIVQMLFGAAVGESKKGIFFSSAGYTAEAREWASRVGVALFEFDLQGVPEAVNDVAAALAKSGAARL